MTGKVFLVGAGPGDPGLLTLRAAELLRRADVIFYDALVLPEVLALTRASAERIDVGKRRGRHAASQGEIALLMIAAANSGKTVVRLKGGDPFVFGRGGEEALALAEAGVPFEVVPGISSINGATAYAGIPVTHRGVSSSFTVVSGHEDPDDPDCRVDWGQAARVSGTLVILMGIANLARIADHLIASGAPATRPAAVIENGTRADQRTVTGTLASIANAAAQAGFASPAIVVVGDVVDLRSRIAWFGDSSRHAQLEELVS